MDTSLPRGLVAMRRIAEATGGLCLILRPYREIVGEFNPHNPPSIKVDVQTGTMTGTMLDPRLLAARTALLKEATQKLVESSQTYRLSYRPPDPTLRGNKPKFHKISIKVRRPGLNVRAREGYYDVPDHAEPLADESAQDVLRSALDHPLLGTDIRVLASPFDLAREGPTPGQFHPALRVALAIDARDLEFVTQPDGFRQASVDVIAAAYGQDNRRAATNSVSCDFLPHPNPQTVTCNVELPLKTLDLYMVRAAVRDRNSGRLGTAYTIAPVPEFNASQERSQKHENMVGAEHVLNELQLSGPVLTAVPPSTGLPALPADTLPAEPVFAAGSKIAYEMEVYAAHIDKVSGKPKLNLRVSMNKSGPWGVPVFRSPDVPVRVDQASWRTVINGKLELPADLAPGLYAIQFLVIDTLAKEPMKFGLRSRLVEFRVPEPSR